MDQNRIAKHIKKEYDKGATQLELATKYGISQSKVSELILNPAADMKMSLGCIKRMFPNATISLDGSDVDISLIHNLKSTIDNIKKLANDNTIPDDKFRTVIKVLLD